MTLDTLARSIHESTGFVGKKLTLATLIAASIMADQVGNVKARDYFDRRILVVGGQDERVE